MGNQTYVIGDIHGAFRALVQCLEKADFQPDNDRLILLGDLSDGWPDTPMVLDLLISFPKLVLIWGNHDLMFLNWIKTGKIEKDWIASRGASTWESYKTAVPEDHREFMFKGKLYHQENNKLFVHAGFDVNKTLPKQNLLNFLLDRTLAENVLADKMLGIVNSQNAVFDEIYLGHTPIHKLGFSEPLWHNGVCLMDTGAGWDGHLSMMNIDTKECFTSDRIPDLYQEIPYIWGNKK